jgi:hypothetical protein
MNYKSIRALSKNLRGDGTKIQTLLAQSYCTDPFYAGVPFRLCNAEWVAKMWHKHINKHGAHIRRIHYLLSSTPRVMPNGRVFENNENCWRMLIGATRDARYLDLIPFDALVDMRNDQPMYFAFNPELDPDEGRRVAASVSGTSIDFTSMGMPETPSFDISGLGNNAVRQDYVVEVWIEKSTQNDWLIPLCQRRGANLVVGILHDQRLV